MNTNNQISLKNNIDTPLVSVIIPVYNRLLELERAIRSVLNQSWQNFEIIIVDDGSSLDIKSICDSFIDKRIKYYRNLEHKNANVARNRGIKESMGEFIAMLDSDDEFLDSHLERRLKKIEEWNCDGIFGSAYVIANGEKSIQISRSLRINETLINYLLSDGFAQTSSHFYRHSVAKSILWDETLERHQDFDFTVRLGGKFQIRIDPVPTVIIHWENHQKKDYKLDSCIKFIARYKNLIDKKIYNNYHKNMYLKIYEFERPEYLNHYSTESYRFIQYVSFRHFYQAHKGFKYSIVYLLGKYIFLQISNFLQP